MGLGGDPGYALMGHQKSWLMEPGRQFLEGTKGDHQEGRYSG